MQSHDFVMRKLEEKEKKLHVYLQSMFIFHSQEVHTFHFRKAWKLKFIGEHSGKAAAAVNESALTKIFALAFNGFMILFALFMPIHVFLIVYSYVRYGS